MFNLDIIRAWKDENYRDSLTEAQRSQLPENPAGLIELTDEDMSSVSGGCCCGSSACSSLVHHMGVEESSTLA
ncbi:mersacidin/lichenicidin family type 2 lantibiotic [Desertifilum sp. FACHB-1129]|uniref:Mersacidin/lichenicidin family type 2 lantibiotic n=2 Tax=Desertifilum tharense IPPAS B-1220 TaxID=1781255 RepID=A0A1E5QEE4_9CYAN|nr:MULTISPECIES: mersacidin/lichenicidin family type 2 lantibiotic [Desertifilum]MDA0213576.1 mersacidin/lichenicidin family type 2 lantibiotic [Cyanobacteria bacterium FC1]MDI9638011.1 mersacidin/lichenicidin family type 2 lantibiotic [Geitlerinema splendidum]MBD2315042.1 mersacidin/lichenicidin family type 2 lantibiotic [Desertifilum sp. FACHB-1129]MBD2325180.1 mersacidin/lichenicidin family type 2 lantibiotic [Desertifilum sp. FACHB-866]MBD2335262.1 mersacidin/lichenicidin family type 2 lan